MIDFYKGRDFLSVRDKTLLALLIMKEAAGAIKVWQEVRPSPHTCSHTYAHQQLKNGCDLYTLSRLLGHENISITQRYLDGIQDEIYWPQK